MKSFKLKRFLLAAGLITAFGGIIAVPAQAYTTINSNCILRAYTPNSGSLTAQFAGQGEVDCNSATSITLSVCLQQLVTGGWSNVTCSTASPPFSQKSFSVQTYGINRTGGRWYRTED